MVISVCLQSSGFKDPQDVNLSRDVPCHIAQLGSSYVALRQMAVSAVRVHKPHRPGMRVRLRPSARGGGLPCNDVISGGQWMFVQRGTGCERSDGTLADLARSLVEI